MLPSIVIVNRTLNSYVCYSATSGYTQEYDKASKFANIDEFYAETLNDSRYDGLHTYIKSACNPHFERSKLKAA